MAEEMLKKTKARSVCRRYLKKIIVDTGKLLREEENVDVCDRLQTNKEILKDELTELKLLDKNILELTKDDKMEEEIMESKTFYGEVQLCITRIDSKMKAILNEQAKESRPESGNSSQKSKSRSAKLPQLKMKNFSGNPIDWPSFWETFEASIHSDDEIEDIMKFNYLKSYLEGPAADAVAGLKVMNSTYKEAIKLLESRFGDKQIIISAHMDKLLN